MTRNHDYIVHVTQNGLTWVEIMNANISYDELHEVWADEFLGIAVSRMQIEASDAGRVIILIGERNRDPW